MAKKFLLGKAPFIRSVDEKKISTTRIMVDVLIALTPIILFAWYKNGILPFIKLSSVSFLTMLWPLLFVLVGGLTSMLLEGVYFSLFKQVKGFKNILKEINLSYACLPGIILALILPLYTPIWILMLGCLMANIVFKMLFGGFGHNIFNPALIAYAVIMAAFAGTLGGSYLNPLEQINLVGISSVTPLSNYMGNLGGSYEELVAPYGSLLNFFIGNIPGSLGETSALLIIVGFIYLVIRKAIKWYVPTIYVGVVFVISYLVGLVNGETGIWYPLFNVLSGGLLFGAVFMATEPVTTPKSPNGKVIFAVFLGIFTCLFRFIGSMPEGVATSILFVCLFTPLIDRFAAIIRSARISKKAILKYATIVVLMCAITSYTVFKAMPVKETSSSDTEIDLGILGYGENSNNYVLDSVSQSPTNYLEYQAIFKKGSTEVKIVFNYDGKDATIVSGADELEEETTKKMISDFLKKLPSKRIESIALNNDVYTVVARIKGYASSIIASFDIKNGVIIKMEITSQNESYKDDYNAGYKPSNGDPIVDLPGSLVSSNGDISAVNPITGATITSNAIKNLYKLVIDYIPNLGGNE